MLDSSFQQTEEELALRDHLAIDRTALANERTLLAYFRTGLTLFLAGVTFVHFSNERWFSIVGLICLPAGLLAFLTGYLRYRWMRSRILLTRRKLGRDE